MEIAVFFLSSIFFGFICLLYWKNHCLLKGLMFNTITGVGALAALSLYGTSIGLMLPFSFYSAILCMALGMPGVILLSVLKILWLI